MQAALGNP